MAMAAIGSILGAQGNAMQNAQSAATNINSLRYNAGIDRQQGDAAFNAANANEQRSRNASNQVLSEQAAGFAEANTGPGGSAYDVQRQSTRNAELDALNERYGGTMARRSYFNDAALQDYQANQIANQGKTPKWDLAGRLFDKMGPFGFLVDPARAITGNNLVSPRNLPGTLGAANTLLAARPPSYGSVGVTKSNFSLAGGGTWGSSTWVKNTDYAY
jgi:hypothetical protein